MKSIEDLKEYALQFGCNFLGCSKYGVWLAFENMPRKNSVGWEQNKKGNVKYIGNSGFMPDNWEKIIRC